MKIACLGGGPAGLYFSILMKQVDPEAEITVFERNRPDDTFGWGVVFSEETLGYLTENDPETAAEIQSQFAHWTDIDIRLRGQSFLSGGHGFCGIRRRVLLNILQRRAQALGVTIVFQTEIADPDDLTGYDLTIACDGINSAVRRRHAEDFGPSLDIRRNKYIWFGATRPMPAFLFSIRETPAGPFWCHAYPFDAGHSTFIVECAPETWAKAGLDHADEAASLAFCERIFAEDLAGAALLGNRSSWLNFITVRNQSWRRGTLVLLGDAAHTAHFSIGSGTKLAMEDAIALVAALQAVPNDVVAALEHYETNRRPDVERLQKAAQESLVWFEHIERYTAFEPLQFAFALLNRSKKVSHDNLRLRDAGFIATVDRLVATQAAAQTRLEIAMDPPPPPMFTPFRLRDLILPNRVVVSPMCQYSAEDGLPNDWHLVHLGSRAIGGAGLVIAEMTDVSPEGRISPGCTGLYKPEHAVGWKRIVDFVHDHSAAKIGIQLGHAGRKGSTRLMWDGIDKPLKDGNWPVVGPSPIPYTERNQTPRALTDADMAEIIEDYRIAARLALEAGFDLVEVHMAHGYLLSTFISPLTNQRKDAYGGPVENRMRFPLAVFDAVRAIWPAYLPVAARISATDWAEGGLDEADRQALAGMLKDHGCDVIDVSAGQVVPHGKPVYGRCFQTPFSDELRNEIGIATIAVGNITTWDEVNSIIAGGRADLCALARPHLADPYWTLHAAIAQDFGPKLWPIQYRSVIPWPKRPAPETAAPVRRKAAE